ncbi:relaxase/mobilization nuclease domain-containing protein [Fodinibius halophilus]|uniref:Relaxase/mobilization nuclease domain-containing protein n=1 Tax=Fodinibius halophilus TaxID=1736908 RepID=A0A6M1TG08_9BACT|nr:relaxase/mobilization nuclease domain-containing protein [Fodinibius halophilus]NGP87570.1 relaxase/mobilization nuclease domain-containing protein [Fodinibius halophilus]
MIAKVGSSTSIQKTSAYLENDPDRVAWKEVRNLADDDPEFVQDQMGKVAKRSKTDEPIYHYSISWDESDNPTREHMVEAATKTLEDLGLADHQALIVAHNDHDYKHLHVMVNRVHPVKGTAWDRWMDYKKLEKSLRSLERSYEWKEVPGHHHQLEGQQKPEYGQSLNRLEAAQVKQGEMPLYMLIRENAEQVFRESNSWQELHHRLAEQGLTIERGSRGTGGKLTDGYEYANLSKVHRDFSMGRLEKRLGPFKSLEEFQRGKQLSSIQKDFVQFEKAFRKGKSKKASILKKGLQKSLKALGTAKKVHNTLNSLLSVSTPINPAFKAVNMMGKTIINQIKQQQTIERGRGR